MEIKRAIGAISPDGSGNLPVFPTGYLNNEEEISQLCLHQQSFKVKPTPFGNVSSRD
jgi:hypothetical protein